MRMRVVRGSMMSSTKPAAKTITVNDVMGFYIKLIFFYFLFFFFFWGGGGYVKSWSFISGLWGKGGGRGRITLNARKSKIC